MLGRTMSRDLDTVLLFVTATVSVPCVNPEEFREEIDEVKRLFGIHFSLRIWLRFWLWMRRILLFRIELDLLRVRL